MAEDSSRVYKGFLQTTGYLNSHLNVDEVPLYRAHLSWIPVFIHQIPFMLAGGAIGGLVWGLMNDFLLGFGIYTLAFVIGMISQIPQVYANIATDILITNQGVHSKKKLVAVQDDKFTQHQYLNDVELDYRSVFQRIFEYGTVKVVTIAGSDENYEFKNLAKPATFKQAVRAIKNKYPDGKLPAVDDDYGRAPSRPGQSGGGRHYDPVALDGQIPTRSAREGAASAAGRSGRSGSENRRANAPRRRPRRDDF